MKPNAAVAQTPCGEALSESAQNAPCRALCAWLNKVIGEATKAKTGAFVGLL